MTHLFQTLFALSVTTVDRVGDHMKDLKQRETGASAVEYALLLGVIVAAVAGGLAIFGPKLKAAFTSVNLNG